MNKNLLNSNCNNKLSKESIIKIIEKSIDDLIKNKHTGSLNSTIHFSQGGIGKFEKQVNEVIK